MNTTASEETTFFIVLRVLNFLIKYKVNSFWPIKLLGLRKKIHMQQKAAVIKPVIEESWFKVLKKEFESAYFRELKEFLLLEREKHHIFPPGAQMFNAFNLTPLPAVKAVIIGQDPYHGPGQAHGLCFSVPKGIPIPPSLKNIYKELSTDIGFRNPGHGNLEQWALDGVLLLNAVLSVRASSPGSHQGKGWEQFTDAAIAAVSENRAGIVFLLWGNYAIAKEKLIDTSRHFVLKAAHPSPLSATRGFFGCRHFSKTNQLLTQAGLLPVNWHLNS